MISKYRPWRSGSDSFGRKTGKDVLRDFDRQDRRWLAVSVNWRRHSCPSLGCRPTVTVAMWHHLTCAAVARGPRGSVRQSWWGCHRNGRTCEGSRSVSQPSCSLLLLLSCVLTLFPPHPSLCHSFLLLALALSLLPSLSKFFKT